MARETEAGLELVEGHKRRWIDAEAGLETVAVRLVGLDDSAAAVHYARDHLPGLDAEPVRRTRRALEERWRESAETLLAEIQDSEQ